MGIAGSDRGQAGSSCSCRMRAVLARAAEIGAGLARTIAYEPRDPGAASTGARPAGDLRHELTRYLRGFKTPSEALI